MKRLLLVICALLTAGILPLMARQKGPSIEFDGITRDVGKVADGDVIHQVFKFTNKGDATLDILSVTPSCGCTSAVPSPSKIAP